MKIEDPFNQFLSLLIINNKKKKKKQVSYSWHLKRWWEIIKDFKDKK